MGNIKREELEKLVGIDKVNTFYNIVNEITKLYDMEQVWNNGGKKWTYEYKFKKWVMFDITDNSILEDLKKLLLIKRKPNRKEYMLCDK